MTLREFRRADLHAGVGEPVEVTAWGRVIGTWSPAGAPVAGLSPYEPPGAGPRVELVDPPVADPVAVPIRLEVASARRARRAAPPPDAPPSPDDVEAVRAASRQAQAARDAILRRIGATPRPTRRRST